MLKNIIEQAEHYHALGLNIVCIGSNRNIFNFQDNNLLKSPNHQWEVFKKYAQDKDYVKTLNWENAVGVGIILGYKHVCAIDIDGCTDFNLIKNICKILGLPDNYQWIFKSGSKVGYHIIVQCTDITEIKNKVRAEKYRIANCSEEEQPFGSGITNAYYPKYNNRNFYKIEFKWSGNIVLPNSLHISGNEYETITQIPTCFPNIVNFERLLAVKNFYGSLQSDYSEVSYDAVFIIQRVAINDEEFLDYDSRRVPPYLLFHTTCYKIKGMEKSISEHNFFLIQISWFIIDLNFNILKRSTFNYFKEVSDDSKFDAIIDLRIAKHLVSDRRNVLFEFLFDLNHVEKIVTNDNTSIDQLKNEITLAGLDITCFYKPIDPENPLKFGFKSKEIIFLNEIIQTSPVSIHDLFNVFLLKQNIQNVIEELSQETINEIVSVSRQIIRNNGIQNNQEDFITDNLDDSNYEKYGGYNGYNDDTIDNAFEGDPENTWNVD